jgi:hypothetical protein
MSLKEIVRISPRFGVMLVAMLLSITFVVLDVLSVTGALKVAGTTGINPFWKLSFVFKCLTDSVILDDFKMALDRLRAFKMSRLGSFSGDIYDRRTNNGGNLVEAWEKAERDARQPIKPAQTVPSPSPTGVYDGPNDFPGFRPAYSEEKQQRHHREHQDSVVASEPPTSRSRFMSFDLEDVVPSAIEDPPLRTMEEAHLAVKAQGQQDEWVENVNRRMDAEADYGNALREMSSNNPPASPRKLSDTRRSHQA